jgi:hypothetical protein
MNHPTPILPGKHAVYDAAKMGKATLFRSPRLLVGLNAFEPGQEHALHAHAAMDKVYYVLLVRRSIPLSARRARAADACRDGGFRLSAGLGGHPDPVPGRLPALRPSSRSESP